MPISARTAEAYEPPFPPELIEETSRFRRIHRLDQYFQSTQYEGRPDFWTGGDKEVPLLERAPCVIYPLPKACVNQATRFTFGEGRFPTIKVQPIAPEDAIAPGMTLDGGEPAKPDPAPKPGAPGEEAKPAAKPKERDRGEVGILQAAISALIEQASLRSVMRTLLRRGLSGCTGVAHIALRAGRFCVDTPHPKNCIPTFLDPATCELAALTIVYRFEKEAYDSRTKHIEKKPHWYRRDITATEYVVFEDAEIIQGKPIEWRRNDAETVQHGWGYCPAVWIPNLRDDDGDPDGCSLYEGLEKEFDALNFALSQRHRGIYYWGVPQPWENLGPGGKPAGGTGRTALVPKDEGPRGYRSGRTRPARRVAPNNIWYLEQEKAEIGLLETTGKAFDAATKHVLDVRARILEAIDVVLMDPTTIAGKGDVSAKALSYMYAPLLALVDELRECWWTRGLLPILGMMLRMIAQLKGKGIYVQGAERVASIAARFVVDGMWFPPPLTPIWGEYFSPSNAEMKAGVETAVAAKGTLISQESATRYVASYFAVDDVDEEVQELATQQEEQAEAEHAKAVELVESKKTEPFGPSEKKPER